MLEKMVGFEAEFLLVDKDNKVVVPPSWFDRDSFPLLGEIRGAPGKTVAESVANFTKRALEVEWDAKKYNYRMVTPTIHKVNLDTYRQAIKQVTEAKGKQIGRVKNIYGTNIDDFSDQVVKGGKIQGVNVSCGLHVHFSCGEKKEVEVSKEELEQVNIPISAVNGLFEQEIRLWRKKGYTTKKTLTCFVSQLNKPAIEWIVKEMDTAFFDKFAPIKKERTKYRQPGFFELKPYGFEYRSLPFTNEVSEQMPEIAEMAFHLLNSLMY